MPRLFVALDLALPQRKALADLIACTASEDPVGGARWIAPAQLHLTLRFFGSVADDQVPALRAELAAVRGRAFSVALTGVGVFPPRTSRKPARVLWAGLGPAAPVRALKAAIDEAVHCVGPDRESQERDFTPHVTLARLQDAPAGALDRFVARHADLVSAPWTVTSFVLYQSQTLPTGSVYQALDQYVLTAD